MFSPVSLYSRMFSSIDTILECSPPSFTLFEDVLLRFTLFYNVLFHLSCSRMFCPFHAVTECSPPTPCYYSCSKTLNIFQHFSNVKYRYKENNFRFTQATNVVLLMWLVNTDLKLLMVTVPVKEWMTYDWVLLQPQIQVVLPARQFLKGFRSSHSHFCMPVPKSKYKMSKIIQFKQGL